MVQLVICPKGKTFESYSADAYSDLIKRTDIDRIDFFCSTTGKLVAFKLLNTENKLDHIGTYKVFVDSNDINRLSDFVDTLSHPERIVLRESLEKTKTKLIRTLYFDYQKQVWIEPERILSK